MGVETGIEWCHHTFNPWWGCEKVSPGCTHCYAETFAKRTGHPVWGGKAERRFFADKHWNEPLKWNAEALAAGERRRVFCASMADVFEDRRDLDDSRLRLWDLIRETPNLDWLLLTKRPESIERLIGLHGLGERDNVWLGTTVESQKQLDRVGSLIHNYAAKWFLSCEPLLGLLDLHPWDRVRVPHITYSGIGDRPAIDWVIVGGESGPGARECNVEWIGDLVNQCKAASIPVFVKQLGAHVTERRFVNVVNGEPFRARLKDRKGGDMDEWPADLRVREFPKATLPT